MKINLTDDELATVVTSLESTQFDDCFSDETREKAAALRVKILDLIQYDLFKKVVLDDGLLKGMKLNA